MASSSFVGYESIPDTAPQLLHVCASSSSPVKSSPQRVSLLIHVSRVTWQLPIIDSCCHCGQTRRKGQDDCLLRNSDKGHAVLTVISDSKSI